MTRCYYCGDLAGDHMLVCHDCHRGGKHTHFALGAVLTLVVVAALALLAGCGTWKQNTVRGLWIAHEVGVAGRKIAEADFCRKAIDSCKARKLDSKTCPELQKGKGCDAARRAVLSGAATLQASVSLGAKVVRAADKPTAAKILAQVMRAAADICRGIKAWTEPPKVCGFVQ